MADAKYVNFIFFPEFSTHLFDIWYLRVFGVAYHEFDVRLKKSKMADQK